MTDTEPDPDPGPDPDDGAGATSPDGARGPGRAVRGWLVVAGFVGGVVAGGLLVGLVGEGSAPVPLPAAADPAQDVTIRLPDAPAVGESAEVVVNADCLRAVNGAQDVVATVDDLAEAAAALNAARLDEVVRRLQPLQGRLRDDLAGCTVVAVDDGADPTATTSPATTAPATTSPATTTSPSAPPT
ncbi:hypothetical protein [Modestobacter roseus]|uniref:Uncharacterized protein n=1 Tax=Modestobacter roseus TaxID=1181884 RepID=A0A562ILT2_9ACTN|nr:hypothetical protein [Modestobacter roseus]MQA32159.1 hypothetical protein [Modestobacter roseus]TWH71653.1 hypothetical protein JD78_00151 [Modestobacter roseus]